MNKTNFTFEETKKQNWFLIDAKDQVLGKLTSKIINILTGKITCLYGPHVNPRNHIIIINSDQIKVTGSKEQKKLYYRHSGRPGGLKIETLQELRLKNPDQIIQKSVKGMLPKGKLGRQLFRNIKIYQTAIHPHTSQQPLEIKL